MKKVCNENYESALSSDCACCDEKNCQFRKYGNPVGTAFFIILCLFMLVLVYGIADLIWEAL